MVFEPTDCLQLVRSRGRRERRGYTKPKSNLPQAVEPYAPFINTRSTLVALSFSGHIGKKCQRITKFVMLESLTDKLSRLTMRRRKPFETIPGIRITSVPSFGVLATRVCQLVLSLRE